MADVMFVLLTLGVFGVALVYVFAADRLLRRNC